MKRKWDKSNKKLSDWIPKPDLRRKCLSFKTLKQLRSQINKLEKTGWKPRFKFEYFREKQIEHEGNYCMIMVRPDPRHHYINGKLVDIKVKM